MDETVLTAYAAGTLGLQASAVAEKHLERCRRCARALARVKVADDLLAEIRDLEAAREIIGAALSRLTSVEQQLTTALHGTQPHEGIEPAADSR
jgi:anti-sigma factor RsiW